MILVYSKGDKFCASTLTLKEYKTGAIHNEGTEEEYTEVTEYDKATANGYVWVSDEDYEALRKHEKCWENGVLVDYTKTAEEIAREEQRVKQKQIADLKANLASTDYQAIKYAEGLLGEDEFAPIKVQRQAWRDEINALQGKDVMT
jgi:hypothetical protein